MDVRGKGTTPTPPEAIVVKAALVGIEGRDSEAKTGAVAAVYFG